MNIARLLGVVLFSLFLALITACERPILTVNEGDLTFSGDTVMFDSIFTTFQTPTERLVVTNNTRNNINISRIWLEREDASEFSLIIDGIQADELQDHVLPKGDSLHVFITLKSVEKDMYIEEFINFDVGGNVQKALIRAYVVDAYFFSTRTVTDPITGQTSYQIPVINSDTTFTGEKSIVIDGPLYVQENVTLTLEFGTHLYFTPLKDQNFNLFSMLLVEGTLVVKGTRDNPVIMEGTRLEENYFENPGQWRGVRLLPKSKDNCIEHAIIKNGLIGIEVDSTSINMNPKLTMRYSEVRNMGAYGLLGIGAGPDVLSSSPAIEMENSMVTNCAEYTLFVFAGGHYNFYNCTFGNYSFDFPRNTPQVFVNNYFEDADGNIRTYDTRTYFGNCIIWGNEANEILPDPANSGLFDLKFENCLLRAEEDYSAYYINSIEGEDPLFNDPFEKDFRPKENSPVIDAGKDFSNRYSVDIRNRFDSTRNVPFDIGAYEYYPIEEE